MMTLLAAQLLPQPVTVVPIVPPAEPDPVAAEILRLGVESATELSFEIDQDGKAVDCVVEKGSGSDKLDGEACRILTAKGQWAHRPAGPARHRTRIVWRIED